ncbi:MAG: GNAT family N-acetyltransferase [Gemmatimonadetes bacterium]|nr:GNAT family N-acetyltransferase [Gemmatimonadota bacterium]
MPATIRQGTPADARRLAELRYEFRAPRAATTESRDEFIERCAEWMRHRLSDDVWRCWIAQHGETIVGHVWLQLIEKIPNPVAESEWHAYVTNLYVQETARGGVGGALMDAALAWCGTREIDYVILWPTQRSRTLYGKKGFAVADAIMARTFRNTPSS